MFCPKCLVGQQLWYLTNSILCVWNCYEILKLKFMCPVVGIVENVMMLQFYL